MFVIVLPIQNAATCVLLDEEAAAITMARATVRRREYEPARVDDLTRLSISFRVKPT